MTVVLLNLAVYALATTLARMRPDAHRYLAIALWNSPRQVMENGYLWQLVVPNLMHDSVLHLAVNMLFVLWFGRHVENLLGSRRFTAFYFMAGLFAYLAYDMGARLFDAWDATTGASGCVFAVLVLHALCFPRYELRLFGFIPVRFWWVVALYIFSDISTFFPPAGMPWVNSVVHLAGALYGGLYWLLIVRRFQPGR